MNQERKILTFIRRVRESHKAMPYIFTKGSCLNFYMILKLVFVEAKGYYNSDHVITRLNDKYYDINGEMPLEEVVLGAYLPLDDYFVEGVQETKLAEMYDHNANLEFWLDG